MDTLREKKILEELWSEFEKNMVKLDSENTNTVVIQVEGGGEKKQYVEHGFYGCGGYWLKIVKRYWRQAKELGFKRSYDSWTGKSGYSNGKFGLVNEAMNMAERKLKAKYPDSWALENVYFHTWID